jgi:hypothetical protein
MTGRCSDRYSCGSPASTSGYYCRGGRDGEEKDTRRQRRRGDRGRTGGWIEEEPADGHKVAGAGRARGEAAGVGARRARGEAAGGGAEACEEDVEGNRDRVWAALLVGWGGFCLTRAVHAQSRNDTWPNC